MLFKKCCCRKSIIHLDNQPLSESQMKTIGTVHQARYSRCVQIVVQSNPVQFLGWFLSGWALRIQNWVKLGQIKSGWHSIKIRVQSKFLKFIYSEKATKYMNFTYQKQGTSSNISLGHLNPTLLGPFRWKPFLFASF